MSRDDGRLAVVRLEGLVADHFEEVVGLRLSQLEARADAEEKAVKASFLDQQQFITFSLNRVAEALRIGWRAELRSEIAGVRRELNDVKSEVRQVHRRLASVEQTMNSVKQNMNSVERKMDAQHEVTQRALRDILKRLPPARA
jgi:septal ring factor EnvC (AmiA/AmiB activator)